ncbi:hypothetical protein P4S72_17365 [Vibrio sp. PP-XX7]
MMEKIVGIIGVNIALDHLTNYIGSLTEKNQLFVSRKDGYILASSHAEDIGENLFEIRPSYTSYRNRSGSSHSYQFKGRDYFAVNCIAKNLGWSVWNWETEDEINAASQSNLMTSITIAAVLIIILLFITYMLVMQLLYKPIGGEPKVIEEMVKKIANGDLSLAGSAKGNETGIFAATLSMVTSLKSVVDNIRHVTTQLNAASSKMSDTALLVKSSSEAQMVQLEQTSTAMNEMSMTVDEVARNALQASTSAMEANGYSEQGINVVREVNGNIMTLVDNIEKVGEVNDKLEQETQSIGSTS